MKTTSSKSIVLTAALSACALLLPFGGALCGAEEQQPAVVHVTRIDSATERPELPQTFGAPGIASSTDREKIGLDHRIEHLRAKRMTMKALLQQLCAESGLELLVLDELPGTLNAEFTNMSVREILDSLCVQLDIVYLATQDKLLVVPKSAAKRMVQL